MNLKKSTYTPIPAANILFFENQREWLNSVEAAAYLGLSVGSLRNMTFNGHIPHYKLGRRNRYRLEDLRELLLSNRRGGLDGN